VNACEACGKNLKNKTPLSTSNERIVEDIPEPPEETELVKIIQEKKYCNTCQRVNTAKSDRALPHGFLIKNNLQFMGNCVG